MPENPNYFKDQALLTSALSWDAVWKLDLFLPITSLKFSSIGDFFMATGDKVFNLWKKDTTTPFFSSEVFFSVQKELAIPSRKTEFLMPNQLGNIIQCDVSIEGRLIITLEKSEKRLKIWYNDYENKENGVVEEPDIAKTVVAASPFQPVGDGQDSPSHKQQMRDNKTKKLKGTNDFKFKSLKDLDNMIENSDVEDASDGSTEEPQLDLDYYMLLSHNSTITSFKMLMPDLYEGFKNAIPTVIATITEKGWIFLWYENLMDRNMAFMCAHVFKPNHNEVINDLAFLDFPMINPERYHDLKEKHSYIFNPEKNKVTMIKKSYNHLGVYENSYDGTTYDWIFLLKQNTLEIYRAEGLRNFPIKNINIVLKTELDLAHKSVPILHLPTQIFKVNCRDFNDKISFYGINKSFQLVKYRRDLTHKSTKGEWQFRNVLIAKRDTVTNIVVHPDYPLFLNKTITNELWFYFEEQTARDIVKYHNLKFIGQYNHNRDIRQI